MYNKHKLHKQISDSDNNSWSKMLTELLIVRFEINRFKQNFNQIYLLIVFFPDHQRKLILKHFLLRRTKYSHH